MFLIYHDFSFKYFTIERQLWWGNIYLLIEDIVEFFPLYISCFEVVDIKIIEQNYDQLIKSRNISRNKNFLIF